MDRSAFRTLCENANTSDASIMAAIMELKRGGAISREEKDAIVHILVQANRHELAKKITRYRKRHRGTNHAPDPHHD